MNEIAEHLPDGAVRAVSAAMYRLLTLQLIAAFIVGLIAGLGAGGNALVSVWIGAFVCLVPNAMFALRITAAVARPGGAGPMSFVAGELIKIGATVALLALAAQVYKEMAWWAVILGMVVTLKGYLLALIWK